MSRNLIKYESLMFAAGVPKRYWHSDIEKIKPISFPYTKNNVQKSLKKEMQMEWIKELLVHNPISNPRMVLSSYPSDKTAMMVASKMISNRIKINTRSFPVMINSAELGDMHHETPNCDFCVLHNIFSNSQPYRLQVVRDFITKIDFCPIIIVLGGINPIDFARNLNLDINRAAYFKEELT